MLNAHIVAWLCIYLCAHFRDGTLVTLDAYVHGVMHPHNLEMSHLSMHSYLIHAPMDIIHTLKPLPLDVWLIHTPMYAKVFS
jgi:hypothetical protein